MASVCATFTTALQKEGDRSASHRVDEKGFSDGNHGGTAVSGGSGAASGEAVRPRPSVAVELVVVPQPWTSWQHLCPVDGVVSGSHGSRPTPFFFFSLLTWSVVSHLWMVVLSFFFCRFWES